MKQKDCKINQTTSLWSSGTVDECTNCSVPTCDANHDLLYKKWEKLEQHNWRSFSGFIESDLTVNQINDISTRDSLNPSEFCLEKKNRKVSRKLSGFWKKVFSSILGVKSETRTFKANLTSYLAELEHQYSISSACYKNYLIAEQNIRKQCKENLLHFQAMGYQQLISSYRHLSYLQVEEKRFLQKLETIVLDLIRQKSEEISKAIYNLKRKERQDRNIIIPIDLLFKNNKEYNNMVLRLNFLFRSIERALIAFTSCNATFHQNEDTMEKKRELIIEIIERNMELDKREIPCAIEAIKCHKDSNRSRKELNRELNEYQGDIEKIMILNIKDEESIYNQSKKQLLSAYASIISDERTPIGKLFKNWSLKIHNDCMMRLSEQRKSINSRKRQSKRSAEFNMQRLQSLPSPSAIKGFLCYFTMFCAKEIQLLPVNLYEDTLSLGLQEIINDAIQGESILSSLYFCTEYTLFQKMYKVCMRYGGDIIDRKNLHWQHSAAKARQWSPEEIGIPEEFCHRLKENKTSMKYSRYFEPLVFYQDVQEIFPRTISALTAITTEVTPTRIVQMLLSAIKILHQEATEYTDNTNVFNADALVPILVYTTSRADIPHIYSRLHLAQTFACQGKNNGGEAAYYITCLEAAVAFICQQDCQLDTKSSVNDMEQIINNCQVCKNAFNECENSRLSYCESNDGMEDLLQWIQQYNQTAATTNAVHQEIWMT